MLTAIGIVPATPLLVPELGGGAARELTVLRDHTVAVAKELAQRSDRWTVLGVQGARETRAAKSLAGGAVGTFAGFGVDVRVSTGGVLDSVTDASMPLPLLIACWLRGVVGSGCEIGAELIDAAASGADCAAAGRALAARLGSSAQREGVLVVADGTTALTPKAPGAFDPRAEGLDAGLRAAFESGDASYLASLDETLCAEVGVEGRAPWQMAAGMLDGTPVRASGVFSDAPYGVGYHAGLWLP